MSLIVEPDDGIASIVSPWVDAGRCRSCCTRGCDRLHHEQHLASLVDDDVTGDTFGLTPAQFEAGAKPIDRLIPDPAQREQAKLALLQAEVQQGFAGNAGQSPSHPRRGQLGRPVDELGTSDLPLRDLRCDSVVGDWQHHRHLMARRGVSAGRRKPLQTPECRAGEFVVALRCRLPGLHRCAQLRQMTRRAAIDQVSDDKRNP